MNKKFILLTAVISSSLFVSHCSLHHGESHNYHAPEQISHIEGTEKVRAWINPMWPQTTKIKKTASSDRYLKNLNASIEDLNAVVTQFNNINAQIQLANKLYHRYQVIGKIGDIELALSHLQKAINKTDSNAQAFMARATILASLHHFTEALTDLDKALKLGIDEQVINQKKHEIHIATGDYHAFKNPETHDDHLTQAKYALLNGEFMTASRQYQMAEWSYQGSNPFYLSWLQLQQGIAFLRYGDIEAANHFFNTAHHRFPQYFVVTEHLAETELLLGNTHKAYELYQQVSKQTQNPQFYAELAGVEKQLGYSEQSLISLTKAHELFEHLINKHPLTISDHAVDFYTQQGNHTKALSLARDVLKNRKNIESWILMANTALQANHLVEACWALQKSQQFGWQPIELIELSNAAKNQCPAKIRSTL